MPDINPDKISEIIRDVAADKIIPRFQQLEEAHIRAKSGPNDLVTIADEEAEIELTRIFKDMFPGTQVVGEEAVSSGKVLRDVLHESDNGVWVVDPVDGTNNFAHGRPVFGTMVSYVQGGETRFSWIYQIPRDRMVAGVKDGGVTIDGAAFHPPIKPFDDAGFDGMRAFISYKFLPPHIRPYVEAKVQKMDVSTYMCCAWEYVDVMEGNSVFSVYKRIEPWDHLAGVLLLEEAGFYVRHWDGTPYKASDLVGGLINAPSKALWERVYNSFLKEPLATRA